MQNDVQRATIGGCGAGIEVAVTKTEAVRASQFLATVFSIMIIWVKQNPQVLVQTVTNNKNETFEILLRKQVLSKTTIIAIQQRKTLQLISLRLGCHAARQITVFQNLWLELFEIHMSFEVCD